MIILCGADRYTAPDIFYYLCPGNSLAENVKSGIFIEITIVHNDIIPWREIAEISGCPAALHPIFRIERLIGVKYDLIVTVQFSFCSKRKLGCE